ncbi:MAG: nodulation protein NodZ [Cyanobacteria bacterium J06638_7]
MEPHQSARYVLVKAFRGGGLGDAIRAVILAVLYAQRTGRQVVVDWSDGSFGPAGENVFYRLFQLKGPDAESSLIHLKDERSVIPEIWRGNLSRSMRSLWLEHGITGWNRDFARRMFSFDQQRDHQETVCVMWDFDALSSYAVPDLQSTVRTALRLQNSIARLRDAFLKEHFSDAMLGVHLRAAHERQVQKAITGRRTIRCTVDQLMETGRYRGIFLATDHAATQEWFLQQYPQTVVRPKPFSGDGSPLHLAEFGQPRLEQTVDALLDMLLLASCQGLLFPGHSSFSLCAAYFSGLADADLIRLPLRPSLPRRLLSRVARHLATGKP